MRLPKSVRVFLRRRLVSSPLPSSPLPQALMSNIGGAATMVGDPPALIIGTALSNYLGFMDFIVNMAPGARQRWQQFIIRPNRAANCSSPAVRRVA